MEVTIDDLQSARNAIAGGASRLEVCSMLSEGGLTPTIGFFKFISHMSLVPCYAMLRSRPGDFVYIKEEIEIMLSDLNVFKKSGVDGFVFGALTRDGEIDVKACQLILSAAQPLPVTFHRAFDQVNDPIKSLRTLIDLGFKRVLTSGQKDTAEEGLELIKKLVDEAQDKIIVMAGSGITKDNISKIHSQSGVKEFHASVRQRLETGRPVNKVKIGANENTFIMETDKKMVEAMVALVGPVTYEQRLSLVTFKPKRLYSKAEVVDYHSIMTAGFYSIVQVRMSQAMH
ncbi:unnamed protein product [Heterotrigona itama]|uniref:Copper homeostasis protein cutC homolog n=1 Tax=Heterotrigona itama TaxID=395501 RepID=A0A6V7HB42_9HYME|nr:unnamed protein product [Heterotrigona itama]